MNFPELERQLTEEVRKINAADKAHRIINAAGKAHRIQANVNAIILRAGGTLAPRSRGELLRQVYEQLLWKCDGHKRPPNG